MTIDPQGEQKDKSSIKPSGLDRPHQTSCRCTDLDYNFSVEVIETSPQSVLPGNSKFLTQ